MREFGGIQITEEFVDDLVDEWHTNDMPTSMEAFIMSNTGWNWEEYEYWVVTGNLPEGTEAENLAPDSEWRYKYWDYPD